VRRLLIAVAALSIATPALAQERPADLTELPPVPTDYTPEKTAWGDWDFSATYQIEYMNAGKILFQRPDAYGTRVWQTDEEFARRLAAAERTDSAYSPEGQGINYPGSQGMAQWMKTSPFGKRTSLIVDPADGQLPALTPEAQKLFETGSSGWVPGATRPTSATPSPTATGSATRRG